MRTLLRLRQWREVLRQEGKNAKLLPMLRALLTGPVDVATFHRRIRTCHGCPVFDRQFKACRAPNPAGGAPLGCGCYVPFIAKLRAPYPEGCWGWSLGIGLGWPSVPKDTPKDTCL